LICNLMIPVTSFAIVMNNLVNVKSLLIQHANEV